MPETVEQRIKRWEELRLEPYPDAGGYSVGWGHRIRPITREHAEGLFWADLAEADRAVHRLLNEHYDNGGETFQDGTGARWGVLVEMAYNLGEHGLRGFERMWAALRAGDYATAADEIIDSKAFREEQKRYAELADIMRTGEAK